MPVSLLAAFATGIVLARSTAPEDCNGLGVWTAALCLAWLLLRQGRRAVLPVWGLLVVAGLLHAHQWLEAPRDPHHIRHHAGDQTITVLARVIDVEQRPDGGNRLLAESLAVFDRGRRIPSRGKLLLSTQDGRTKAKPGQVIQWRSRLRTPVRFGNPGEFDYPLSLAARGIHVTAFAPHGEDIAVLVNHPQGRKAPLMRLRQELSLLLDTALAPDQAAHLKALLLGRKDSLLQEQRKLLADSGIAHLFAISGLHFGLLAFLLYQLGRWLYTRSERLTLAFPPQRVLPILLILPLAGYLLLTGQAWSTQRAFLTVLLLALFAASGRRTAPCDLLASVALCLLILNPLALFQPGFQLSFAGVAGMIAWLPASQRALDKPHRLLNGLLGLLKSTVAATLATAPIVMWYFHQFAPAGLVANLIAIPMIAWGAVPLGLCSLATLPLSPPLAEIGLRTAAALVDGALDLAVTISTWPGLKVIPVYLTRAELVLTTGILISLLPMHRTKSAWRYRVLILILTLGLTWSLQRPTQGLQVIAFSVGQGDATLVSLADDKHFLIDGGGLPGSTIDPGERLIAPALGRLGVDRLEGIVLTHNHPDHNAGLTAIIRRFPVRRFYHAGPIGELPGELRLALAERHVEIIQVAPGWHPVVTEGPQQLALFAPRQSNRDVNERSIAVYAGEGEAGALLTADLGPAGLQQLSTAGLPGPAGLLKLPHHGSRHADPAAFLGWTGAQKAFVSCGRGNPYGFPHSQTLEACEGRQVDLARTDLQGMLTFEVVNGRWQRQGDSISAASAGSAEDQKQATRRSQGLAATECRKAL